MNITRKMVGINPKIIVSGIIQKQGLKINLTIFIFVLTFINLYNNPCIFQWWLFLREYTRKKT